MSATAEYLAEHPFADPDQVNPPEAPEYVYRPDITTLTGPGSLAQIETTTLGVGSRVDLVLSNTLQTYVLQAGVPPGVQPAVVTPEDYDAVNNQVYWLLVATGGGVAPPTDLTFEDIGGTISIDQMPPGTILTLDSIGEDAVYFFDNSAGLPKLLNADGVVAFLSGHINFTDIGGTIGLDQFPTGSTATLDSIDEDALYFFDNALFAPRLINAVDSRTFMMPSQLGNAGKFLTTNGIDVSWAVATTGGTGGTWGTITGTLSAQTDLQAALDAKQPLDGDLTSLASLVGTNNIYYRSATSTWTPVVVGSGLSFSTGTLNLAGLPPPANTVLSAFGSTAAWLKPFRLWGIDTNDYFGPASPDGGITVNWQPSNPDARIASQDGFTYIDNLGFHGSGAYLVDVQTKDDDLTALSALTGTHTIYYRSGTSTWSALTIGAGLSFVGATLSSTVIGGTTPPGGATTQVQYNSAGAFAGSSTFTFDGAGKIILTVDSEGDTTTTPAVQMKNTTAATSSVQQDSPAIQWTGQGWKNSTSTSQVFEFRAFAQPIAGTGNPDGIWHLQSSFGGGAWTDEITVSTIGTGSMNLNVRTLNLADIAATQAPNGGDMILGTRNTDTTPTGNILRFQNAAANTDILKLDVNGQIVSNLDANNLTGLLIKRKTDTTPTGNFVDFKNAAGTSLYTIDVNGAPTAINFSDITTGNASTTAHGYLPKLDNNSAHFLNGQGGWTTPTGGGSVTSFSAGNLSPIFTSSVATATTTPALTFSLSTAAAHTFLGNNTGSTAAPAYVQPAFTDLSGNWTLAQGPTTTASVVLGRTSASSGIPQEITLGTNLSMSGTTLNATGGGGTPGGSDTQVQYNHPAGTFAGSAGFTFDNVSKITLGNSTNAGKIVLNNSSGTGNITLQPTTAAATSVTFEFPADFGGTSTVASRSWVTTVGVPNEVSGVGFWHNTSIGVLDAAAYGSTGSGNVVLANGATTTNLTVNQAANNDTTISCKRFTDTTPGGYMLRLQNAANSVNLWLLDVNMSDVRILGANNITALQIKRATDTSPTGNFQDFQNAAGTSVWKVDITGLLTTGSMDAARITAGTVATARLGSGTASGTTFLRGDQTWAAAGGGGNVATDTIWDTKGDLAVGTGADTAAKLVAGANDTMLMADSAQTTGLKWGTPATVKTALGIPAGSDTQIQFNDAAALGSDADLTWNKTTNTLTLGGADTGIVLQNITNLPSNTSAGLLRLYAHQISGHQFPLYVGPSGLNMPLQSSLFRTRFCCWSPSSQAAAGSQCGAGPVNPSGNDGFGTIATTNRYTAMRRQTKASVVTTANQQVGLTMGDQQWTMSSSANQCGFFLCVRFGFDNWTAGDRLFVGLSASTITTMTTVNPSSVFNLVGFGIDAGDTAITFMHNDGSGTATKDTIAGQPALATNNAYVAYIFCKPNDSNVYYRLDNFNTDAIIIDTSTNTDTPGGNNLMRVAVVMGNAANVAVNDAKIGVGLIYIEADW